MLPLVLLLVAPSPPPLLLASNSSTSRSSTGSGLSDVEGSSFTAIHIGLIFLGVVLCIIMCAVPWDSLKCCAGGSSSGGDSGESSQQQQQGQASGSEVSPDEEEATQRGLSKQVIRSFKVVRYHAYARQQQQQEQIECAICLAEFRNGQKVRMLPQCGHGFHKHCIDKWLLSHTSCPICRNPLLIRSPEKGVTLQQQQQQQQQSEQHREDGHEEHQ